MATRFPSPRPAPPAGLSDEFSGLCLLLALLASAVVVLVLMLRTGLAIDIASPAFAVFSLVVIALAALRARLRVPATHWQARWRDFSEGAMALLLLGVLGAVGSYEAAADSSGFYDAVLVRSDQLLHFDWLTLYRLVVASPTLQHLGAAAYGSIYLSPLVLLAWLAWHGQRVLTHQFLLTFWAAAVLTLALFPLLPARGALEYLWHGPIHYMPTNGLYQGTIIPALRDHSLTMIDLGAVRGLVCAPSFHTACAVVYMVTAWPFIALRRVLVPVNLAMLAATPVEGTHYLTDMVLGAIVATVAVLIVRKGLGWRLSPARRSQTADEAI